MFFFSQSKIKESPSHGSNVLSKTQLFQFHEIKFLRIIPISISNRYFDRDALVRLNKIFIANNLLASSLSMAGLVTREIFPGRKNVSTTSIQDESKDIPGSSCASESRVRVSWRMAIRNMRIDYGIPRVATVVGIRMKNREREKERRGRKGKEIKGDGWKKKRRRCKATATTAAVRDNKCEIGSRRSSRWLRLARASNDRDYLNIVR